MRFTLLSLLNPFSHLVSKKKKISVETSYHTSTPWEHDDASTEEPSSPASAIVPASSSLWLVDLPSDVLQQIYTFLNVPQALNMSLACRVLCEVMSEDSLWKQIYTNSAYAPTHACGAALPVEICEDPLSCVDSDHRVDGKRCCDSWRNLRKAQHTACLHCKTNSIRSPLPPSLVPDTWRLTCDDVKRFDEWTATLPVMTSFTLSFWPNDHGVRIAIREDSCGSVLDLSTFFNTSVSSSVSQSPQCRSFNVAYFPESPPVTSTRNYSPLSFPQLSTSHSYGVSNMICSSCVGSCQHSVTVCSLIFKCLGRPDKSLLPSWWHESVRSWQYDLAFRETKYSHATGPPVNPAPCRRSIKRLDDEKVPMFFHAPWWYMYTIKLAHKSEKYSVENSRSGDAISLGIDDKTNTMNICFGRVPS